jgi:hypothetical protein
LGTVNYTVNSYKKYGGVSYFWRKGTVKIGGQYLNELEYQNIEGFERFYQKEILPTIMVNTKARCLIKTKSMKM